MGRKGGGGGTAGGGRSGKRGNVTFTRVVPRFLQDLKSQQAMAAAKSDRRMELSKTKDCKNKGKEREGKEDSITLNNTTDEIAELEKAGFNVVDVGVKDTEIGEDRPHGESGVELVSGHGECSSGKVKSTIPIHGGIEKKQTGSARPTNAFKLSNAQRLSFTANDSDSSESSV